MFAVDRRTAQSWWLRRVQSVSSVHDAGVDLCSCGGARGQHCSGREEIAYRSILGYAEDQASGGGAGRPTFRPFRRWGGIDRGGRVIYIENHEDVRGIESGFPVGHPEGKTQDRSFPCRICFAHPSGVVAGCPGSPVPSTVLPVDRDGKLYHARHRAGVTAQEGAENTGRSIHCDEDRTELRRTVTVLFRAFSVKVLTGRG